MTDQLETTAIRAQMDALTGWTGKPHVSTMEFGPNVAAKARKIIGQLCDALDAERANVGRIGRELNVEQAVGAQLSDLTYERGKALRAENERLRAALTALTNHSVFYDREYLSDDLNAKLDAGRAALAQKEGE